MVDDSVAQFEGARSRTYLAVLIEREAIERLRVVERAMGEVDATLVADHRPVDRDTSARGGDEP